MSTHRTSPSRARWAVLALCCAALWSCKHDADRVAAFIAASDELQAALCACASDGFECQGGSIASACEERVVRKHAEQITSWLTCATRELRAEAECVRSSGCTDDTSNACDVDLDAVCGEVPRAAEQAIESDLDRLCTEPIDCEDGSTTGGRFCNGVEECSDGSDEVGCDEGSGAGGSAGSGAASMLPPPPPSSAPFGCPDGSAIPVELVCDGVVNCAGASDEDPCFVCADGPTQRVRASLTCDGVLDCADGSDERDCTMPSVVLPPPSAADAGVASPATDMCIAATPAPASINPSCIRCGCGAAPMQVIACDQTCWALIECVLTNCPDVAGTPDQTSCVVNECSESLAGATSATALGPVLTERCADVCPPF